MVYILWKRVFYRTKSVFFESQYVWVSRAILRRNPARTQYVYFSLSSRTSDFSSSLLSLRLLFDLFNAFTHGIYMVLIKLVKKYKLDHAGHAICIKQNKKMMMMMMMILMMMRGEFSHRLRRRGQGMMLVYVSIEGTELWPSIMMMRPLYQVQWPIAFGLLYKDETRLAATYLYLTRILYMYIHETCSLYVDAVAKGRNAVDKCKYYFYFIQSGIFIIIYLVEWKISLLNSE